MSLNVNGIRSACEKGFWPWFVRQKADVLCLQELRADESQLPEAMVRARSWHAHYFTAERKGYSGVAVISKKAPNAVHRGFGWPEIDSEARIIRADFDRVSVASIYVPSGSSGEVRQGFKMAFLERLAPYLVDLRAKLAESQRQLVLAGDFNIAHQKIDLANWRGNQKNSGFLPEERAFLDKLYGELGFVDAFRVIRKEEGLYTWWSNRGQARDKNVGWRLDLQVTTAGLGSKVRAAEIYVRNRFSDHAPLTLDYDIEL